MIPRRAIANLVFFLLVTAALVTYGALDLLRGHLPLLDHPNEVSAIFKDASGLRTDFSASFNGVVVGTVKRIRLQGDGVKVTVALDHGVTIPSDVEARVIRASPVGEQRIDFVPTKGGTAAPLRNGAVVPTAPNAEPPVVSDVVDVTVKLLEAIPADQLNILIHETAVALQGRSDDIRSLVETSDAFSQEFLAHEQGFRQLLASAPPVLDAVSSVGPQLRDALTNTSVLTSVLAQRRADLVTLLQEGARLGTVGNDLVASQKANLACLVSDVADITKFTAQPRVLNDLNTGLHINQQFFGPIDKIAPFGPAIDVGLGAPARDNQVWLRVRTLVPPGQPAAVSYNPKRPTPPTKPGGACTNEFGQGVGPATQANPEPPAKGGSISPPSGSDNRVTPTAARSSVVLATEPTAAQLPVPTPTKRRDAAPDVVLVAVGMAVLAVAGRWRPWRA
jgi:virulence factor Mce-like protein